MKTLMKIILISFLVLFSQVLKAQEKTQQSEKYRIITGVRVNPVLVYDLKGNVESKMLLHGELGALLKKKLYLSVGYTGGMNAVYNFNEYWFIGFDKKVPVSWVIAEEYMLDKNKVFVNTGLNIKLSPIGNLFVFAFSPIDNFNLGLKVGVFIPLNVVVKKK